MSTSPETDFDLELHFLPAWAQKPADENRYAHYQGGRDRGDDRKGERRDRERGPRRREQPSDREGAPRRPQGERPRRPTERAGTQRRGFDRPGEHKPSAPPAPLPEINVAFVPDEKGVDSLTRQIKMTGRAYPLFEIAQMILQRPERHSVTFSVKKKAEGAVAQPLFVCALDDTLWLSEDEAVRYVLDKHFTTFYQPERTQIEPPKGTYTFVAQCGLSDVILGPPNYHDYQNRLRKLHAQRFARMPFDAYKARVKIVRDEAVVKKWLDDQSWKTEYICLNLPEPLKLATRDEVEKHFRETHLPNIIKSVETFHLSGGAARNLRSAPLLRLVRHAWEEQRRFPLQIATVLSQQFAARGLQFFKVNRTVTHVAVARPHYLDLEAEPVSEGIRRIVHFISAVPKCTRRQLFEALAPGPAVPPQPEGTPRVEIAEPTPEQTAVISDLHWLIHQGHVIEFANGVLETAKKPIVKPPKPAAPAEDVKSDSTVEPDVAGAELHPRVETAPARADLVAEAPTKAAEDASRPPGEIEPAISAEQELASRVEVEVSASSEAEAEKAKAENPSGPPARA